MKNIPSILDIAYSPPTEYLYLPFQDNLSSTSYFGLTAATEPKEVGRKYPQVDMMDHHQSSKIDFDKLIAEPIVFEGIKLFKSAKLTDHLSCVHISAHAYLISQKALEVFQKFNLGKHAIYPAKVYYKDVLHNYFILHMVNEVDSLVDFQKSRFTVTTGANEYLFDITIKDNTELNTLSAQVKAGIYPKTEEGCRIVLTKGVFADGAIVPDLFTIYASFTWHFVSRKLGQAILQNKLTGFQIHKSYELFGEV